MTIISVNVFEFYRLTEYFFQVRLSNKFLSESEIRFLEKGLDFSLIQRKANKPRLRRNLRNI